MTTRSRCTTPRPIPAASTVLMSLGLSLASGCASLFLSGGTLSGTDLSRDSSASFQFSQCIDPSSNTPSEKPQATAHLLKRDNAPAVFERSPDGSGTLITNHWRADDADHYFAWINAGGVGYEYVFPAGSVKEGKRVSYVGMQTRQHSDGSTRPTSAPSLICTMVPLVK